MTDIFEEVQEAIAGEGNVDGLEIEHSMLVNPSQGTVTPGINISAIEIHAPLFFSIKELRDMADEAERLTIELMNQ